MGVYINPRTMSKEEWLGKNGLALDAAPEKHFENGKVAVCLVDNTGQGFTAAAVAYSQDELDYFAASPSKGDKRPQKWYWVPLALLPDVTGVPKDKLLR